MHFKRRTAERGFFCLCLFHSACNVVVIPRFGGSPRLPRTKSRLTTGLLETQLEDSTKIRLLFQMAFPRLSRLPPTNCFQRLWPKTEEELLSQDWFIVLVSATPRLPLRAVPNVEREIDGRARRDRYWRISTKIRNQNVLQKMEAYVALRGSTLPTWRSLRERSPWIVSGCLQ